MYVCRELSCKQLFFQNHNVLFYTTVYIMYNYFTVYLHRIFCFIVNSLDAEDGESNKVISPVPILANCLIISRVLSSR